MQMLIWRCPMMVVQVMVCLTRCKSMDMPEELEDAMLVCRCPMMVVKVTVCLTWS